jgi:hypothetical protein
MVATNVFLFFFLKQTEQKNQQSHKDGTAIDRERREKHSLQGGQQGTEAVMPLTGPCRGSPCTINNHC